MRFTGASGPWRSVELRQLAERLRAAPVAVSHDPPVAQRFRCDPLLLTGPKRVWVTAVIRSRLERGERSAAAHHARTRGPLLYAGRYSRAISTIDSIATHVASMRPAFNR
jgi:hypothetical protein